MTEHTPQDDNPTLAQRVRQFGMLELPGQPRGMHMGTSYLVHDLWASHQSSQDTIAELVRALHAMFDDYRTEGCADPTCNVCRKSSAAEALARAALARAKEGR